MRAARNRRFRRRGISLFRSLTVALIFAASMLAAMMIAGLIIGVSVWNYFSAELPDLNTVEARQFQTTRIYDRNWKLLYEVNDPQTGFRTYSSLDEITGNNSNRYLINATVAAEDRTFWENFGIDPMAILRGLVINVSGEGTSGGSTITQQLVRQLYPDTIGYERSLDRKAREAIVAMQFTSEYSKEEILELYFNTIYYGNRAYGIDAAAKSYFNKRPAELTLAEAALLAGLPQAPSAYDPTQNLGAAKSRQRYVLDQMVDAGFVSRTQAEAAWEQVLIIQPREQQEILAPHWVNYVISELEDQYGAELVYRGGLSVRTSLDYDLQVKAQQTLTDHLADLGEFNANTGAIVEMLPGTGEIVSMVGSADYFDSSISGQFNVATSERQPGSAFMPVVYASAFEQGWSPAHVIFDYPSRYSTPGAPSPEFVPENTSGRFNGAVPAGDALAQSLNVPAVKTLDFAGVGPTIDLAHQLGIRTGLWRGLDFYGLALALGAGEVSPLELTTTYATFANNGRYIRPNPVLEIRGSGGNEIYSLDRAKTLAQGQQVIRPETAYLINSILSNDEARLPTYGPGNALEFPELDNRPVAAKIGTSFDWFDNWTVGYSSDLVVGVWIGNANNQPLEELDGALSAAPIFHDIMVEAHADEFADTLAGPDGNPVARGFQRPDGIIELGVCDATGGLSVPGMDEHTVEVDQNSRPTTRCDQLTATQWNELQAALRAFSQNSDRFTTEGVDRLLSFSQAVDGGIGVPDQPAEPTPTPTPTALPEPTSTPMPSPTPRPTVTPVLPPTPTPLPTPVPTSTPEVDLTPEPGAGVVQVPDLFGLSQSQAIRVLAQARLQLADVLFITQDDLPPGVDITDVDVGEVFFQSPTAGVNVPRFSSVTIAIRSE